MSKIQEDNKVEKYSLITKFYDIYWPSYLATSQDKSTK